MTEDEMIGRHHRHNGHEFEQTLEDSEGEKSLGCCSMGSQRAGHDLATEQQIEQMRKSTLNIHWKD